MTGFELGGVVGLKLARDLGIFGRGHYVWRYRRLLGGQVDGVVAFEPSPLYTV